MQVWQIENSEYEPDLFPVIVADDSDFALHQDFGQVLRVSIDFVVSVAIALHCFSGIHSPVGRSLLLEKHSNSLNSLTPI